MNKLSFKQEPVAWQAALNSTIAAVLLFLNAFDIWHPTDDQQVALYGLFAIGTAWAGLFVRKFTVPFVNVDTWEAPDRNDRISGPDPTNS